MERNKLIEIARSCGKGDCHPDCPYRIPEGKDIVDPLFCMEDLMTAVTGQFEKAMADIEYAKSCYTCLHNGKSYKEPPCSLCTPLEFDEWQWKGDSDDI